MLDLQKYKVKQYEIKWFDGEIIKINMPSQNLLQKMVTVDNLKEVNDQINEMKTILRELLNNNTSGRTFTVKEVNELALDVVEAIFMDYMDYVNSKLGE